MADFAKLLVTTDFSERALSAVATACALAQRLGSRVELLYVVEDHLPPILIGLSEKQRRDILEEHRSRAEAALGDYADEHLAGCDHTTAAVVGVAAREIVRHAGAGGHDLILIASRGYGPIGQLLIGSTAERVLHHAPCPVMVVPSRSD